VQNPWLLALAVHVRPLQAKVRYGQLVLQVRAAPWVRVVLQERQVRAAPWVAMVPKLRLVLHLLRHILLHMRRSEQPSNLLGPVGVELGLSHSAQRQPLPVLPQPQQAR